MCVGVCVRVCVCVCRCVCVYTEADICILRYEFTCTCCAICVHVFYICRLYKLTACRLYQILRSAFLANRLWHQQSLKRCLTRSRPSCHCQKSSCQKFRSAEVLLSYSIVQCMVSALYCHWRRISWSIILFSSFKYIVMVTYNRAVIKRHSKGSATLPKQVNVITETGKCHYWNTVNFSDHSGVESERDYRSL